MDEAHEQEEARSDVEAGGVGGQESLFEQPQPQLPARLSHPQEVPRYEDVVLTDEDLRAAAERWPDASEALRRHWKKQSILATLRHRVVVDPATGRRSFGGVQPNTGKKRAMGDSLVEVAEERRSEIMDALFAPLDPKGNTPMERHKAAATIIREVRKDREVDLREDELARASREDLEREGASILADMIRSGQITINDDGDVVEAEVVEG